MIAIFALSLHAGVYALLNFRTSRCAAALFVPQQPSKQEARTMKAQHIAAVAVLLLGAQLASAQKVGPVDFSQECPGNLLVNGGFEEPNTEQKWTQLPDPTSNSKWGWYEEIPGR